MSWEWSHTNEAYENARENLSRLSVKTLQIILAEWAGKGENNSSSDLDLEKHDLELKRLRLECKAGRIAKDTLVDAVWEKMEEYRTCTNGGWEAYACPFGCHKVSFSTFAERMAETKERKKNRRK